MKNKKNIIIVLLIIVCLGLSGFFAQNYKSLSNECNNLKTEIEQQQEELNLAQSAVSRAVESWENTIKKLNLDMDIAFFGDSLTYYSDFQKAFPDKKIINLGYGSEGVASMCHRYTVISTVKPEKIFIMGGINYFAEIGEENIYIYMCDLVELIKKDNPNSEIYVQSILPVTKEKAEAKGINSEDIAKCNQMLKEAADKNGYTFIDLYSLYEKNGYLNNEYTKDGIHIADYSLWENEIKEYIYN